MAEKKIGLQSLFGHSFVALVRSSFKKFLRLKFNAIAKTGPQRTLGFRLYRVTEWYRFLSSRQTSAKCPFESPQKKIP
jgi:hypothetical protein